MKPVLGSFMKRDLIFHFLCIFIVWVFFNGCEREKQETISTETEQKEYPSQEGWNSEIRLSKAGQIQAVVRYGHMMKYDKRKIVFFDEGVEVDFYDNEGNHTSHLTSEKGEYHENTEDVLGRGSVVVVSDSGVTLSTDVLRWDNRLGKILSDTTVRVMTTDSDTLYGLGFESDPDLNHWIIKKPWGVSQRRIDIEKLEKSFSKTSPADTVSKQDLLEVRK